MATLNHDDIDDFVLLTLDRFKRNEFIDLSLPLQEYEFASRWFAAKKRAERGGVRLNWKLRVNNQGTAKHSGLYAVDDTNRINVMTEAKQEWSKTTCNYIYDIDEDAFQSDRETIIREMQQNELGLYNDFFALMETAMWTAPASDSVDPRPPSGIPCWLVKNSSLGFTGADPSGFSSGIGSISTDDYARWKNYSGTYTLVSRDDLVEKVITALDKTRFKAPKAYPEIGGGPPDYGFYTVYSVLSKMRQMLQASNDNLGIDVARFSDGVLIRGNPVEWVPALSETESEAYDDSAPFYGINWKKFEYFFKSGRSMLKHPPKVAANQHCVRERHMDNWGNFVCYDRRQGGFVFYTA